MRTSRLTICSICLAGIAFVTGCGPGAEGSLLALLPVLATAPLDELNKQYVVIDADATRLVIMTTETQPFNPLAPPTVYHEPTIGLIVYDLASNTARRLDASALAQGGYAATVNGDWMASLTYAYPENPADPVQWEAAQRGSHVRLVNLRTGAVETQFAGLELNGKAVTQVCAVSDRWLVMNVQDRIAIDYYTGGPPPLPISVIVDRASGAMTEVPENIPPTGFAYGYSQGMLLGDEVIFLAWRVDDTQPTVLPDGSVVPPGYAPPAGFDLVRFNLATHERVVVADAGGPNTYPSLRRMGASIVWDETTYDEVQSSIVLKRYDLTTGAIDVIYSDTSPASALAGSQLVGATNTGLVIVRGEAPADFSPLGIGARTTVVHRALSGAETELFGYTIEINRFPWFLLSGASQAVANGDGYVVWRDPFDGDWKLFDVASGGTRTIVIE